MTRKVMEHKRISIHRERISLSLLMKEVKGHGFSGDEVGYI